MITTTHPEVSIIVPLYNKVNEVQRAIDSIFAQTVQDFELIIVDGGSTDGSLDAIKKYETDPRYYLIHQASKGVSNGRNDGIKSTSCELVAFLDADDEWCPNFLEYILSLWKNYPHAGIYATAYATDYRSHVEPPRLSDIPSAPWRGILKSYFRTAALAFISPFTPSCVAIPKSTFDTIGYFNPRLRIGEDTELWGRIALECDIAFTSCVGAIYHTTADNRATDNPLPMTRHPFAEYLDHYPTDKLIQNPDYENILLYLQKEEVAIALNNLYAGAPKQARANLHRVTDKHFLKQKYGLLGLSYLPKPIMRRILPIANCIGRK